MEVKSNTEPFLVPQELDITSVWDEKNTLIKYESPNFIHYSIYMEYMNWIMLEEVEQDVNTTMNKWTIEYVNWEQENNELKQIIKQWMQINI